MSPPKLFVAGGNAAHQYQAINRVTGNPRPVTQILDQYSNQEDAELLKGDGAGEVGSWKALPVHPKVACLFMRGMPIRRAFLVTIALCRAIPENFHPQLNGLLDFMRLATLSRDDSSALSGAWNRADMADTPELESWHLALCDGYALHYDPPTCITARCGGHPTCSLGRRGVSRPSQE